MIQPSVFYAAKEMEKADLLKHEYAAMWNTVFRIKKVPVNR